LAIFDAPSVHSSDIRVRFEANTVFVQLDRSRAAHDDYEMTYPGRGVALDGEVTLPADATVDPASATATVTDDGTLHVRLPKADETASEESNIETQTDSADGDTDDETTSEE
jgi:HSP20 family molecular chaperone IbpA